MLRSTNYRDKGNHVCCQVQQMLRILSVAQEYYSVRRAVVCNLFGLWPLQIKPCLLLTPIMALAWRWVVSSSTTNVVHVFHLKDLKRWKNPVFHGAYWQRSRVKQNRQRSDSTVCQYTAAATDKSLAGIRNHLHKAEFHCWIHTSCRGSEC